MNFNLGMKVGNAGVSTPKNKEWVYLLRVVIVIAIIGYILYKMYFAWWVGGTEQPSAPQDTQAVAQSNVSNVIAAGETSKEGLNAEMSYYTISDVLIVDKETFDVLLCNNGVSREGCTHTEINCANISDVDLWLRPEENLKRCIRNIAQGDNARYNNPNTPPACQKPERLHFSPSTMSYECK